MEAVIFILVLGFVFVYDKLESIRKEIHKIRIRKTKPDASDRAVQDTHKSDTYSV